MSLQPHRGSDLLLGLSLAEIFMLFVLVIWLDTEVRAHPPPVWRGASRPPSLLEVQAERDSVAREAARYRGFADIIPPKYRDLPHDSLKGLVENGLARVEGGRGAPACYKSNILFEAHVVDAHTTIIIRSSAPLDALRELQGLGAPPLEPGMSLSGEGEIDALLGGIEQHNLTRQCRYDYVLRYMSNDDRVNGEDRFERFCYTAKRTRVER